MEYNSELIWRNFLIDGNEYSFATLYNYYADKLYSYGINLGFESETCKDAIQDVFIKIHTLRTRLLGTQNPASFLFKSYKNRLIDIVRSNKGELNIDTIQHTFSLNVTVLDDIIDEERANKLKDTIETLLNKLSPTQREAIYMRYIAGMDYSEISELLNIKPESARKLMHRAMEKLRQQSLDDFTKTALVIAILASF